MFHKMSSRRLVLWLGVGFVVVLIAFAFFLFQDKGHSQPVVEQHPNDFRAIVEQGSVSAPPAQSNTVNQQSLIPCDQDPEHSFCKKDATHVYLYGQVFPFDNSISPADPSTFEILSEGFAKDVDHVYSLCNDTRVCSLPDPTLPNADVRTFVPIQSDYGKDTEHVYFQNRVLDGADPKTLIVVNERFVKDASSVWDGYSINSAKIDGVDPATFVPLSDCYAKDVHGIHNLCKFIEAETQRYPIRVYELMSGADSATFRALGGRAEYAVDANAAYYRGDIILGADPKTFAFFYADSSGYPAYAKDAHHLYMNEKSLPIPTDIDMDTLVLVGDRFVHLKDKNSVYLSSYEQGVARISGADPASFKSYGTFGTDKRAVYCKTKEVEGADPTSFKANSMGGQDKRYVYEYWTCTKVVGADGATFTNVPRADGNVSLYSKDKNNVYYFTNILPGADLATFTVDVDYEELLKQTGGLIMAKDKNHFYYEGRVVQ